MSPSASDLAQEVSQGNQELNDALARANQETAPLTEADWELLSSIVDIVLVLALLPAEATVGAGVVGAGASIAAVSAVLAGASSFVAGSMLAMDICGIRFSEQDRETRKIVTRFVENPYTIMGGTFGLLVDGDRGFRSGVTAGEFGGILFDINDTMESTMEGLKSPSKRNIKDMSLHIFQIMKELKDFSPAGHGDHVRDGQHIWADHLNTVSITRDMIESPMKISKPAVVDVTDNPPIRPSSDEVLSQSIKDRGVFSCAPDLVYSPQPPISGGTPNPTPGPTPGNTPGPAPLPVADPPPVQINGIWNTPLLPNYLGGGGTETPYDPPLSYSAPVPEVPSIEPDGLALGPLP